MQKKMMAVLVALAFALTIAPAQAANTTQATTQSLSAKTSVDAVSKATTKKKKSSSKKAASTAQATAQPAMDMPGMAMTPVEDLTPSENPLFPVSTEVIVNTDHMSGMMGAKGVVSGAYDTTLYAVDYTDASGTEVKNHRWVIAEEIVSSDGVAFEVGDTVTMRQGHMEAMGGAGQSAVIVQIMPGPAYMVDYDPTDGSARVMNHQWVAEFELKASDAAY